MLRETDSSRLHERDAVYHHATVSAQEDMGALATRIRGGIVALKAARRVREDTEDATAVALAARNVANAKLDDAVRAVAAGAFLADRQRPTGGLLGRLFPDRTAAEIGGLALDEELGEVAKLQERLALLPEGDPTRRHLETLGARATALQEAITAYGAARRTVSAARVREDQAQLEVRRALGANRGTLIEMHHGDTRAAGRYFRTEPRNGKTNGVHAVAEAPVTPAPTPAPGAE